MDKAERVKRYARHVHHELEVIAHSCEVAEPRQLNRTHCRIVMENGKSIPLSALYPEIGLATAAGTTILAAKLRKQWVISLTLGVVTATVDFYVHPGTFGTTAIAEAMVTGVGAASLSYFASLLFMLRRKTATSNSAESA